MKRALIIGASGYVGQSLCQQLSHDHQVLGTYHEHPVEAGWQCLQLDIRDRDSVGRVVAGFQPDIIFHLAYSMADLEGSIEKGTHYLIEARNRLNPACGFVFVSTDIVFSGNHPPYKEMHEPDPILPYGESKKKAENMVRRSGGVIIRTSLVYGFDPHDPRTLELLQGLETGEFAYPYFADEYRCPIFIDDLCAALIEIGIGKYDLRTIWHVAGPETLSRYVFARKLARAAGFDPEKIPRAMIAESGLTRPLNVALDCTLARKTLGTRFRTVGMPVGKAGRLE